MKKIGTLILAIGLVFGFSGCKTEPEEETLEKIEITAQPSKTEYLVGEELDTTGLEVTATYSDESTKDVTAEVTATGYDKEKAGEQTVTVSYTENEITKTAGFTVAVKEKDAEPEKEPGKDPGKEPPKAELTKIEITAQPSKTEYLVGEELDTTGLEVTANYSDGSTKDVTAEVTATGYDKEKAGEQTVTVSYTENEITKTAGFTVTVKEKDAEPEKDPEKEPPKAELTKIEITTQPEKKEYYPGDEALDLAGMKVTATYNDNSTKDVTAEATTSGFDSSDAVKSQTITVTYGGKTATFTISILFSWLETPKQLTAGTDGTYGTEGTYVYFGVWPQDVVPKADETTLGLETSTEKVTRGYMDFVKGSDGNYYVKCAENAYDSGYKYNKDNSDVGQGGTNFRWFKVMPIKWRVLTENYNSTGNALLLAENELTANVPYYEDWENNRTIGGNTVYPNNYEHSQIRAFLNGLSYQGQSAEQTKWNNKGFLQTAFTSKGLSAILTTEVENGGESTTDADKNFCWANGKEEDGVTDSGYDDYTCPNTNDKIFLLSEQEVTTSAYGFAAWDSYGTESTRIRVTTDFAKANYAYQSTTEGYGGYWWMRSPYYSRSDCACLVDYDGYAPSNDYYVDDTFYGVVPALSIKLQ